MTNQNEWQELESKFDKCLAGLERIMKFLEANPDHWLNQHPVKDYLLDTGVKIAGQFNEHRINEYYILPFEFELPNNQMANCIISKENDYLGIIDEDDNIDYVYDENNVAIEIPADWKIRNSYSYEDGTSYWLYTKDGKYNLD